MKSEWKYREEDRTGEDFEYITCWWSYDRCDFPDHETAAKAVAKYLCSDEPDYYSIFEREGMDMEIQSPEGEIKKIRVTGYTDFCFSADELD